MSFSIAFVVEEMEVNGSHCVLILVSRHFFIEMNKSTIRANGQ